MVPSDAYPKQVLLGLDEPLAWFRFGFGGAHARMAHEHELAANVHADCFRGVGYDALEGVDDVRTQLMKLFDGLPASIVEPIMLEL